ncbi:hypothetical protein MCI89_02660 [Muricomes sp. OA1]|uniref:hypothetical protein n=1 Tax=Faecalicatena contorta TaxID=39482 RepID=UPI0004B58DC4|nr:hypothetical protein [Faecalicatena contorta]MCH1971246.1 hypothetical protein [Muricomes sp. OA1]
MCKIHSSPLASICIRADLSTAAAVVSADRPSFAAEQTIGSHLLHRVKKGGPL